MDKYYDKYIAKLVVDLIKIDRVIHPNELRFIEDMIKYYGWTDETFSQIHNLKLEECILILKQLDTMSRMEILNKLEKLIYIDNDLDIKERFLFFAIKLALSDKTKKQSQIISTSNLLTDFYSKQIIYLEKKTNKNINNEIDKNYDKIDAIFQKGGLDFIYLPKILERIKSSKSEIVSSTMKYIIPTYSNCNNLIDGVETCDFYNYIFNSIDKNTTSIKFDSFLLLKIQTNFVIDDRTGRMKKIVDFLCYDFTDNVVDTVWDLYYMLYFDRCKHSELFYNGYYRMLYSIITEKSKVKSKIIIDSEKRFILEDALNNNIIEFSGIQEKVLYLLYWIYGNKGLSKSVFNDVIENLEFWIKHYPRIENSDEDMSIDFLKSYSAKIGEIENVVNNIICIYKYFTKTFVTKTKFDTYLSLPEKLLKICVNRSEIRSKINGEIRKVPSVKNLQDYMIQDRNNKTIHYINLDIDYLELYDIQKEEKMNITDSEFWRSLRLQNFQY